MGRINGMQSMLDTHKSRLLSLALCYSTNQVILKPEVWELCQLYRCHSQTEKNPECYLCRYLLNFLLFLLFFQDSKRLTYSPSTQIYCPIFKK